MHDFYILSAIKTSQIPRSKLWGMKLVLRSKLQNI